MEKYVQIDDCQNNLKAIVKVDAITSDEAEAKALKALHSEDRFYYLDKEEALALAKDEGIIIIDENGNEADLEDEEDSDFPSELEIKRPGWIDDEKTLNYYVTDYLQEAYERTVLSYYLEFDARKIYISNIKWGNDD